MSEGDYSRLLRLERGDLEQFAVRAAIQIAQDRRERRAEGIFLATLTGFLLGALIVSSAFVLGRILG